MEDRPGPELRHRRVLLRDRTRVDHPHELGEKQLHRLRLDGAVLLIDRAEPLRASPTHERAVNDLGLVEFDVK
jgi:hypothetical protein